MAIFHNLIHKLENLLTKADQTDLLLYKFTEASKIIKDLSLSLEKRLIEHDKKLDELGLAQKKSREIARKLASRVEDFDITFSLDYIKRLIKLDALIQDIIDNEILKKYGIQIKIKEPPTLLSEVDINTYPYDKFGADQFGINIKAELIVGGFKADIALHLAICILIEKLGPLYIPTLKYKLTRVVRITSQTEILHKRIALLSKTIKQAMDRNVENKGYIISDVYSFDNIPWPSLFWTYHHIFLQGLTYEMNKYVSIYGRIWEDGGFAGVGPPPGRYRINPPDPPDPFQPELPKPPDFPNWADAVIRIRTERFMGIIREEISRHVDGYFKDYKILSGEWIIEIAPSALGGKKLRWYFSVKLPEEIKYCKSFALRWNNWRPQIVCTEWSSINQGLVVVDLIFEIKEKLGPIELFLRAFYDSNNIKNFKIPMERLENVSVDISRDFISFFVKYSA